MNEQQRLADFLNRLELVDGLNQQHYERLVAALESSTPRDGYDENGRLRVAMYDAQSYDRESFELHNDRRHSFHYLETALDRDTARAAAGYKVVCLFVNDCADAEVLEMLAARGVEMIALRCAGFNNVDLAACERFGISVARVPAYSPYAVAEHALALMLMLNRNLHRAYYRNMAGYFVLDGLTGFDMRGKVAGVAGTGKIGAALVGILLGLGCRVLAFDKFPSEELAACEGVEYVGLDRLYAESDIISLHVPLFPETHHMIDADAIGRMKPGVMLINTSRGALVDTRALIEGLKSGRVGSAGLDVYEEESGIFFHNVANEVMTDDVLARLMTFKNVVVTSHQAFLTREALANIAETTFANIAEWEDGKRGAELSNAVVGK